MIPINGRVQGRTVQLDDGYDVADGERMEGWVYEVHEAIPAFGPLTAGEARWLLGPSVVAACTRRGIDLPRLDWSVPDHRPFQGSTWYHVIPRLDDADPWPIWLPLFAHLLRLVETAPEEVWSHMRDVQVVTTGLLERAGKSGLLASNARLIALLVLRVVEFCSMNIRVGPHGLFEIQSEAHTILQVCMEAQERAEGA